MGVEVYEGFAAADAVYDNNGSVTGIITSDVGINKQGNKKPNFSSGIILGARHTLLAEGCRGSLSEIMMKKYDLRKNSAPQLYGIGIKEVWELDSSKIDVGSVSHTVGYPLDMMTYGGSFMYQMRPNLLHIGLVVALGYKNPYLNPYQEFQKLKNHPAIRPLLETGRCISYGSRALNEGGLQAIPELSFPGGSLIGCSAGFLNIGKIKGTHTAMKSGMIAAEDVVPKLLDNDSKLLESTDYGRKLKSSWIWPELKAVRNVRHSFDVGGLIGGLSYSGFSMFIGGKEPWTFKWSKSDSYATLPAKRCKPITYESPDGVVTFDILDSVSRSGTNHEHDQPSHLKIKNDKSHVPTNISWPIFAAPETRFCPAKVYEYMVDDKKQPQLVINAQNCVHCKTCSIKAPEEYVQWNVPEGGGGPSYSGM
eukprot:GHVL01023666.1.p1 GENE.GHVL01023666.1~~GHVL01023666.1.p1  ORF type:complete len:422 (+),score=50.72 GHVL01023666.1:590-1855(+)